MLGFVFFTFLAITSGVACLPNINVYTTTYENKFKKLENQTCPYDSIDIHPKLGNVVFLIVGLNDYTEITKNSTFEEEYRDLEDNIRYNHKAHLVLLGCADIGRQELHLVDNFIKETAGRKIRTYGYGNFNTNYTISNNFWDDDDVDLLLSEFMRTIHGDDFKRVYSPNEYITIYDANPPLRRLESYLMNTKNGRFDSKIIVTFILIGGDKMDEFLANKKHKDLLLDIAEGEFDRFELVFLMGCYNFRTHFYLIADVIENQKGLLVENYRGPMKNESIHVHVQGREIWSSDFVFRNNSNEVLISNIDIPEVDPFLDLYYIKTSRHTEYDVYDCNLKNVQQLGFQYINGEYQPHATEEKFMFDTSNAEVMKIIFVPKKNFEKVYSKNKSRLKQLLKNIQITNHKVYLIVCHAEISTYPNVISTMLETHLGNYMKKNLGEVWLHTPNTFAPIRRNGDGGQFRDWPFKPIDDILGYN